MEIRAEKSDLIIKSRFKILKKLGQGERIEMFLAEDVKLKRKVAIKKISSSSVLGSSAKAKLLIETQSASQLEHPNICTVYETYEENDDNYIVMQYVDGIDLKQIMKLKGLSVGIILNISLQLCRGMEYANAKGILHRDLKPENIMVDLRGAVKILDFGLIDIKDHSIAREKGLGETNWVEKGLELGVFSYMSPEQVRGQQLDFRTDIFSFGCVLYEMLEGVDPFHDQNQISILYNILNKDVKLNREIPLCVTNIVLKCLAKEREQRFADFTELRDALEGLCRLYENGEKKYSEVSSPISNHRDELFEIVERVKRLSGATDPLYSTQKKKMNFYFLPFALIILTVIVFFLIKVDISNTSSKSEIQRFYIFLHPFENNTQEEELAEKINFLLYESLNQFDRFKAINQEAVPVVTVNNDIANNSDLYLKKFEIKYHLKGRIYKIKDTVNIDAELILADNMSKRHSITVPGISGLDSLLIHQIDTLADTVFKKIFPNEEEDYELKKISGIFGTSWEQFSHFFQGLKLLRKVENSKAENFFYRSKQILVSKLFLANLYVLSGRRSLAEELVKEIKYKFDRLTKYLRLKTLAIESRLNFNYHQEIQYLKQLKDEFNFSKDVFFELAEAFFHFGNTKEAIPYYKQAIKLSPGYAHAINRMGYCHSYLGFHRKALEFFECFRDLDRSAKSFDSLGDGYFYAGEYISAEACKRAAISMDRESFIWSYLMLTNIYIVKAEFGKAERALESYNELIPIPQLERFSLEKRTFIYFLNREYERALKTVNQSLSLFNGYELNRNASESHWLKGVILLSLDRKRESQKELFWLEHFKDKYKLSKENYYVPLKYFLHLKALILEKEGSIKQAEIVFRALITMKSQLSYHITYYNFQYFYSEYVRFLTRNKEYIRAFSEINRCLEFNQNYIPALWIKAEICEKRGNPTRLLVYRRIANLYGESDEKNYFRDLLKKRTDASLFTVEK